MNRNLRIISEIGKELRRIRKQEGTSLQEVADKSDVSVMYISEIERSRKIPSDELVNKLSKIYNVPELDMYEGFKKIPEKVEEEIIGNSILFELLFKIAHNEDISKEDKNNFYVIMNDSYGKLF